MEQTTEPQQNTAQSEATPSNPAQPSPSRARSVVVLLVVAVVVAGMIYFSSRSNRSEPAGGTQVTGRVPASDAAKGKPAPDFTLVDLNGNNVKLSDYRGKAVLVNFWATWCGPCKIEMPWLVELKKQYGPQGFEIVGVATDVESGKKAIDQFAKDMGVNYQVVLGADKVSDAYGGIEGLPTNFFVDRNGTIVNFSQGLVGKGEIEDNIKLALGSSSPAASSASQSTPSR